MESLKTCRKVLIWLFLYPSDKFTSVWKRGMYVTFGFSVFTANLLNVIVSTAFFLKYISIDLEECLYALFEIVGFLGLVYIYVIAFLSRQRIQAIFEKITRIYDKYTNDFMLGFLAAANNQCEWIWEMYFKFALGGFVACTIVFSVISVLICFTLNGEFDAKFVYHPNRLLLPWDRDTLLGYIAEIIFDITVSQAYLLANGAILLLFISVCLHHEAFHEMLQYSLSKLNQSNKSQSDKDLLCKLNILHITAKDLFADSSMIYSPIILIQLITSAFFLACAIFELDLEMRHIDINLGFLLIVVSIGGSNLFLYCFFGKLATESYRKMADSLYEANWVVLPIELQKYFVLLIGNAQMPIYYHGFSVAVLNLETFCKLIRAVVSYYMMFKTITD